MKTTIQIQATKILSTQLTRSTNMPKLMVRSICCYKVGTRFFSKLAAW